MDQPCIIDHMIYFVNLAEIIGYNINSLIEDIQNDNPNNTLRKLIIDREVNSWMDKNKVIQDIVNNSQHFAVTHDSVKCLKFLIENGADVNFKNRQGNTPLHFCDIYKMSECFKVLVDNGADTTIKNKDGKSFLDFVENDKTKEEVENYIDMKNFEIKEPSDECTTLSYTRNEDVD